MKIKPHLLESQNIKQAWKKTISINIRPQLVGKIIHTYIYMYTFIVSEPSGGNLNYIQRALILLWLNPSCMKNILICKQLTTDKPMYN